MKLIEGGITFSMTTSQYLVMGKIREKEGGDLDRHAEEEEEACDVIVVLRPACLSPGSKRGLPGSSREERGRYRPSFFLADKSHNRVTRY